MRSTSPTSAGSGASPTNPSLARRPSSPRRNGNGGRIAVPPCSLIAQGATAGERDAARAALRRLEHEDGEPVDQELRDLQDEEEAAEWGEL